MLEEIKLLLKLQELDIILAEARIVHKNEKNTDLVKEKVDSLREKIDESILSRYDRLTKQGLAVVQEMNGMCLGCNLSIPVGDLNRIRTGKMEPSCPNCGKFLAIAPLVKEIINDSTATSNVSAGTS